MCVLCVCYCVNQRYFQQESFNGQHDKVEQPSDASLGRDEGWSAADLKWTLYLEPMGG